MKNFIKLALFLFAVHSFVIDISAQTDQKAELVVQLGHSNIVGAVAFSPDGKYIVTGDSYAKVLILWETASGKEIRRFVGHDEAIIAVAYSHNGQFVASIGRDKTLRKWDVLTGRELVKINLFENGEGNETDILSVLSFSSDDLEMIVGTKKNVSKFELNSQQAFYRNATYSNSGVSLSIPTMQIWNAVDGKLIKDEKTLEPIAISPDGKFAFVWHTTSLDDNLSPVGQFKIWNLIENRQVDGFESDKERNVVKSANFSPDSKSLSAISIEKFTSEELNTTRVNYLRNGNMSGPAIRFNTIIIWDVLTGDVKEQFIIDKELRDSKLILVRNDVQQKSYISYSSCTEKEENEDWKGLSNICSVDLKSGDKTEIKLERFLGYLNGVVSAAASADGRMVAFGTQDSTTTIINVDDNKIISWLTGKMPGIYEISTDNADISTVAEDNTKIRWDLNAGQPVLEEKGKGKGRGFQTKDVDVTSPDGKLRVKGSYKEITLQAISTNEDIFKFAHSVQINSAAFSTDNLFVVTGDINGVLKLWSVKTGKLVRTFDGHSSIIYSIVFMPDGKTLVTGSMDSTTRLWDVETGKEKARLITAFDDSWTVITPEGLFDASPGARKLMHYVAGMEVVTLDQMKDVYYVPGLLKKIFNGDPLPKVELFSGKDLFPKVEFSAPKAGQKDFSVKLTNRGGGIGQVQVLVNGKEISADLRPRDFNINTKEVTLNADLQNAPLFSDKENKIEVIARNASGSLTNRGTAGGSLMIPAVAKTRSGVMFANSEEKRQTETPHIYIIAGGISNYTGDHLKLNFAAKDAEDFARALELGAGKLVGDKSKVHIRLLTSNGANTNVKFDVPDAKISTATKADFQAAFDDFRKATTNDVFIVYLAGHGVSINLNYDPTKAGGDTYLYLTQEATTSDKYDLSAQNLRNAMTISAEELKELMKKNNALKQVLILDTCASGQAAESFVQKRGDMSADQIRAIERLKDNTGFYILMGSAADSVSYEANEYGQGLLTYSLLQGMKGFALENNDANIAKLFDFATKEVPEMAKNIGGIQQPRIITPDTSRDFPIGRFTESEQKQIVISNKKPIILSPELRNTALRFDNLNLSEMMTDELRQLSYVQMRGEQSKIVFVDKKKLSDAVQPVGDYTVDGENLKISVILISNNKIVGKEISMEGKTSEPTILLKKLIESIMQSLNQSKVP